VSAERLEAGVALCGHGRCVNLGNVQCSDSKGSVIAVWDIAQISDPFSARLTVKHTGLSIVTELLTTLTLNRISYAFKW
jgi:hypothetical protein